MNFDFTSPIPEQAAREELEKHLEEKHATMKPAEYLKYRRFKLHEFNNVLQHLYAYQRGIIAKQGDRPCLN
jgi:hypothetical protein